MRVKRLSSPQIISTWQFLPDQRDPTLAGFTVNYSLSMASYMRDIDARFRASSMWREIEASGDCETRIREPSAGWADGGTYLHIIVEFKVDSVKCNTAWVGSRIAAGSSRYKVTLAAWPVLPPGGIDWASASTVQRPPLKFQLKLISTRSETSGETAFLWDTLGKPIFGAPSREEARQMVSDRVTALISNADGFAVNEIAGSSLELSQVINTRSDLDIAGVATPLRRLFAGAMKPTRVGWFASQPGGKGAALFFERDLPIGPDGRRQFPFVQKVSVMCALANAMARYFAERPNEYRIIELVGRNAVLRDAGVPGGGIWPWRGGR